MSERMTRWRRVEGARGCDVSGRRDSARNRVSWRGDMGVECGRVQNQFIDRYLSELSVNNLTVRKTHLRPELREAVENDSRIGGQSGLELEFTTRLGLNAQALRAEVEGYVNGVCDLDTEGMLNQRLSMFRDLVRGEEKSLQEYEHNYYKSIYGIDGLRARVYMALLNQGEELDLETDYEVGVCKSSEAGKDYIQFYLYRSEGEGGDGELAVKDEGDYVYLDHESQVGVGMLTALAQRPDWLGWVDMSLYASDLPRRKKMFERDIVKKEEEFFKARVMIGIFGVMLNELGDEKDELKIKVSRGIALDDYFVVTREDTGLLKFDVSSVLNGYFDKADDLGEVYCWMNKNQGNQVSISLSYPDLDEENDLGRESVNFLFDVLSEYWVDQYKELSVKQRQALFVEVLCGLSSYSWEDVRQRASQTLD